MRSLICPLANALHTSATIFEALSDIDSKFAKVVDKEYDGVSNEVKKWFKKLAVGLFITYLCYYKPRYYSEKKRHMMRGSSMPTLR